MKCLYLFLSCVSHPSSIGIKRPKYFTHLYSCQIFLWDESVPGSHNVCETKGSLYSSSKAVTEFLSVWFAGCNLQKTLKKRRDDEDGTDAVNGLCQNKNTGCSFLQSLTSRWPETTGRTLTLFRPGICHWGNPLCWGCALCPDPSGCPTSACCASVCLSLPRLPRVCLRWVITLTPRGRSLWTEIWWLAACSLCTRRVRAQRTVGRSMLRGGSRDWRPCCWH